MSQLANRFFVYGTLKSDQLRGRLWPHKPLSIEPALVRGVLIDMGPYPAVCVRDSSLDSENENDWILGELWTLDSKDVSATLRVLDQIEGFVPGGDNQDYIRHLIPVHPIPDEIFRNLRSKSSPDSDLETLPTLESWIYTTASSVQIEQFRRILPWKNIGQFVTACWPDPAARVPRSFAEE